jgi:hypothetical protein
MRADIVVTTIFEPRWLPGYLDNLRRHGRSADVTLRIIGDRKTSASVWAAAAAARRDGFRVECPTLEEQESFLKQIGAPADLVPWNTDNRRNIGFLQAWQEGADVLISIDDDNYCGPAADFVGEHLAAGRPAGAARVAAGAPWFNLCSLLTLDCAPVYPRGFPYRSRVASQLAHLGPMPADGRTSIVAINTGLWLDDPDVDAVTRLSLQPRAAAADPQPVILGPETWSPINTQNTAVMRAAIPAYYYVRMGFALQGLRIDRFGDILSGYFVQKCAKHLGHSIRIGSPVVQHVRTPHDLFNDLYHELAGMVLLEELLPWLQELRLSGGTYGEAYAALADALAAEAARFRGFVWDDGGREFLLDTARCMKAWLALVR